MLACFEAMARLGSRQAAAEELNVTDGAVAKQLRALEQWLHTPLFESGSREAAMTAAGRRLAQAMTAAMETIQLGLDEIGGHPATHKELRILVPAALSTHWLLPRLPQIEQADLGFRLRVHMTHTGEDWLSLPHDAAIRRDAFLPPGYRQELLFQEELAAYVKPGLIDGADCKAIDDLPLLESRTRPGDLDRWLAACRVRKPNESRQVFGHFYTAYEAALAGEGLIVAPTVLAAEDVRNGRLVPLNAKVRLQGAQHMLLWRKADEASAQLIALAAWLKAQDRGTALPRVGGRSDGHDA
jgi:LysR family transcriptional regulator, glycine cleavage system transcriptional activator